MSYLTHEQLQKIGFKSLGNNVKISEKASIYNPSNISIDDNARIDDFCILSAGNGGISIGKFVHIGCYSSLIGEGAIILNDLSGISGRVSIYSSTDDFTGPYLSHPTIPDKYKNIITGDVILKRCVVVGASTVILPNVTIGTAVAVGSMSLVKDDCLEFGVYAGVPAKRICDRSRDILKLEQGFLNSLDHR